jgi:glucosamine 6-phosphate synthetase-like amidotransferase/phosphosugar isomerase protein
MCGISGICLLQGHNFELEEIDLLFSKLLAYSTRRGGDATGAAIVKTNGALVFKHHVTGREFIETDYYNEMMEKGLKFHSNTDKTMILLGHNRAQTKGTYLNRHNNHPIIANRVVGIHNGWINNDDALFKLNQDNFNRKAQVDSEIIFRLIDYYAQGPNDNTIEAIKETARRITGSYACAAVNLRNPWVLWLFKATGPTVVFHYPKRGITVFASEEDILDRAAAGSELGAAIKIPYSRDEGLGINVLQNCKTKFKLSRRGKIQTIEESCNQLCAL